MNGEDRGSKPDEATKTLVGARPIKMLEAEKEKLRAEKAAALKSTLPATTPVTSSPTPVPLPVALPAPTAAPEPPRTLEATGLPTSFLEELCLKHLFDGAELRGGEISRRVCLPPVVVEEVMERLRQARLVDIKGTRGVGIARTQTIFALTELGSAHCDLALKRDRYLGPAPVAFASYVAVVRAQSVRGNRLSRAALEPSFADLVLASELLDTVGPAMNGGRSMFVHGPPGNGKTAVCQRVTRCFGGLVYVPFAVYVDGAVITIYDPGVHEPAPARDEDALWDERWVRCRRPTVTVGGDLALDDLELRYAPDRRYYEAPVQLKANGGVLLIDDFGRQRVEPATLLNRWIVPLESDVDFLSTSTGKKVEVPFDVFVIFSTNLDPSKLVDRAFLRRVRYKVEVTRPDLDRFEAIFVRECDRRGLTFNADLFRHLVDEHYRRAKRPFNACEPRDLLDQVRDLCTWNGIEPMLSREIIDAAASSYFARFGVAG
jgi:hypothetical protein